VTLPPPPAWRAAGWAAVILLTLLAGYGISRLRIDDDLRSLIRDGSQAFAAVDEISAIFGPPDRDCIVRVEARDGDIFARGTLEATHALRDRLAAVPGVEGVRSIFDVRRQGVAGVVLPVIPRTEGPLDPERRAEARGRALDHPLVAGQLLSPDGDASLMLVRLDVDHDQPPALGRAVAEIEAILAAADGGPLTIELTGIPALREQATRALRRDMIVFNSLGLSLALIISASVARSLRSTLVACLPPFIGAVWAMGVLGLCDAPVNILTSVVPSLALVVGTCDSIHFIEDMRASIRCQPHPGRSAGSAPPAG